MGRRQNPFSRHCLPLFLLKVINCRAEKGGFCGFICIFADGMKSVVQIIVAFCALCLLSGCGDKRVESVLVNIDTVISSRPDSALLLLDSLKGEKPQWPRSLRMRHDLLTMKAQNKAYIDFTSDSVGRLLVDYYDSHGTTNERVQAHYLLGCAYRDLGEAPLAVNSYMDAIAAADTTSADFDFYTLSTVYSQLSESYHRQLLLTNEIEARRKASHYAYRANQPLWGIYNLDMSAGAYILLNKKDSAEIIQKQVMALYDEYGYHQRALQTSEALMYLYTEQPGRLSDLKQLMDRFEAESDLFDEHHELPPSDRQYYYYKGRYYEGIGRLDSAEYYYRKISRPNMDYVEKDPIYKGLLSVFQKRHLSDSIAKYAQLYCEANDSSIALKDQDLTAQTSAAYRYNRIQKIAHENETRAYKNLISLIVSLVATALLIIIAVITWKRHQQELDRLKTEFADTVEEYKENLQKLQVLESAHKNVISVIQAEANYTVSHINETYEAEKSRLLEENQLLKTRIEDLQKEEEISKHLDESERFAHEEIVQKVWKLSKKPMTTVPEDDWSELMKVFSGSYPALFRDLSQKCKSTQGIRVCILTVIGIGGGEQANLLGLKKQRVSNIKSQLNKALFNEASSRTLRKNLIVHYNIYNF